jgi:hypothetical protein
MKLHRKLAVALATVTALGAFSVSSPAANATPTPVNPTLCVVAGNVSLSAAVHLGGSVTLIPPVSVSATASAGIYTFVSVQIICAGTTVIGAASATSTGNYDDYPLVRVLDDGLPVFTGNYTTGPFSVTGNACNGSVGGSRVGAVIAGTISLNCGASVLGPATTSVAGAIVLGVAPDPAALTLGCPVISGTPPGPTTVTCDPLVSAIVVAGAAVFV